MSKGRAKRGRDARDEYDFSNGVRGKYTKRFAECSNVVVIAPDIARRFPDSTAVNEALREFLAGTRAKAFLLRLARRRAKRSKG